MSNPCCYNYTLHWCRDTDFADFRLITGVFHQSAFLSCGAAGRAAGSAWEEADAERSARPGQDALAPAATAPPPPLAPAPRLLPGSHASIPQVQVVHQLRHHGHHLPGSPSPPLPRGREGEAMRRKPLPGDSSVSSSFSPRPCPARAAAAPDTRAPPLRTLGPRRPARAEAGPGPPAAPPDLALPSGRARGSGAREEGRALGGLRSRDPGAFGEWERQESPPSGRSPLLAPRSPLPLSGPAGGGDRGQREGERAGTRAGGAAWVPRRSRPSVRHG